MIPVLQITRGPETLEEEAAYNRMNALWNAFWESVATAPQPNKSRGPAPSSVAAAVALAHYIHEAGFPNSMRGFVKAVHAFATERGLPGADRLDDRITHDFAAAIVESFKDDPG